MIAEGNLQTILDSEASLTGAYLRERPATPARRHMARFRREHGQVSLAEEVASKPRIEIRGARAHNLQGVDVEVALGSMVAVTGVSGSGKSTLVKNVLHDNYQRGRGVVDVDPGECEELVGLDQVSDVVLVDQQPLGRSARSIPVTSRSVAARSAIDTGWATLLPRALATELPERIKGTRTVA